MGKQFTTVHGDCLNVLKAIKNESIDSIVTDPPYGLGLMGMAWDRDVPSVAVWSQCLRILKPGGHIVAFAGTRTQHRMAVAIEDAGFQIRDMLAWCYSTGFPKSTDQTLAMERFRANVPLSLREMKGPDVYKITAFLKSARDRAGWTNRRIDQLFGTNGMAGHWTTSGSQPLIPSWRQWQILKEHLSFDDSCDELVQALAGGERPEDWGTGPGDQRRFLSSVKEVGEPQNWGTGLKPAIEPITLARKPFSGTNAANVQQYGTGAIHLKACRYDVAESSRWPANLITDGSDEVDEALAGKSRLFFCPKASRKDRDEGCEQLPIMKCGSYSGTADGSMKAPVRKNIHPTVKPTELMQWLCRLITPSGGLICDPFMGSGSTGKAAILEGFRFIGCDLDKRFVKISRARIASAARSRQVQSPTQAGQA